MHRPAVHLDDLLCLNCAQMFNANINHEQQLRNDGNVREKFFYKVYRFLQEALVVETWEMRFLLEMNLRDKKWVHSPSCLVDTSFLRCHKCLRTKPKWKTSLPLLLSCSCLQLCSSNFGTSFDSFIHLDRHFFFELSFTSGFTRLSRRFSWIFVLNLKFSSLRSCGVSKGGRIECKTRKKGDKWSVFMTSSTLVQIFSLKTNLNWNGGDCIYVPNVTESELCRKFQRTLSEFI